MLSGHSGNATFLPPEQHSGIWIDGNDCICLKLQRRKNRPQGSLLRRACSCASTGPRTCAVHRLKPKLASMGRAEPLWQLSAHEAVKSLRRLLTLLKVTCPDEFTLKAFRAGRATALAAAGKSVVDILLAGEWRSAAFLSYVDSDLVDSAQLLVGSSAALAMVQR